MRNGAVQVVNHSIRPAVSLSICLKLVDSFSQALEQYCRKEAGYVGLTDVYLRYTHMADKNGQRVKVYTTDSQQQSFFLAETLK